MDSTELPFFHDHVHAPPPDMMTESDQTFTNFEGVKQPSLQLPRDNRSYSERCYWFGKQFFTCLVAEVVFRNDTSATSYTEIDAALMKALNDFPVAKCSAKLSQLKSNYGSLNFDKDSLNHYNDLLAPLGAIVDSGDASTKRQVALLIQSCISRSVPSVDHWDNMPPSPPDSEGTAIRDSAIRMFEPRWQSKDIPHNGVYTSRLMEWGQRPGNTPPKYVDLGVVSTAGGREAWEYLVQVHGQDFKGTTQSKKEAKNMVSKKACEYLGIRV